MPPTTPAGRWPGPGGPGAAPPGRDPERRRRSLSVGTPPCRGSARGYGRPPPTWGPPGERRPAPPGSRWSARRDRGRRAVGRRRVGGLLVGLLPVVAALLELPLRLTERAGQLRELGAPED